MTRIALDIETTLEHDKIWCCVTKDLDTSEVKVWKTSDGLQEYLDNVSLITAHNGISFDFPVLRKVWNVTVKKKQVIDTLVLSRLYNPPLEDGHSLAAWGQRLGYPKTEFNDFNLEHSTLDEMITYCVNDVEVLSKLYEHLIKEMKDEFSQESITLEHEVQVIICQQERNGFKLNVPEALQLLSLLKTKLDAIQVEMATIFPAKVTSGRTHKTTGKPLRDIVEPFNPGSRKQIAERLVEKGWKPTKHTEKGSVIIDEDVLDQIIQECS